ncbi:MAG: hypothetical protein IT521_14240 [Burkholderiales bacterium]|nr:hypothetical protein [Burkholderiales bacterium]
MADQDPAPSARSALVRELQRVQRLHEERKVNPILVGALDRLANWQARRLRMTYADLAADPRFTAAIEFFQNDLYGSADFSRRDADLARVVPVMVKMLPESVIRTTASAMELNGLSQELDRVLLARLPRADGYFTVAEYCKAYRRAGNFPLRGRQIRLIGEIGQALDRFVGKPLVRTALAMMRQPARLAGMSALQDFLERGFAAFRDMGGAEAFLRTIDERETQIMEAIIGGAIDPFPDPLMFRLSQPATERF